MPTIVSLADTLIGFVLDLFVFAARIMIGTIVRGIAGKIPLVGSGLAAAADDIADAVAAVARAIGGNRQDTSTAAWLTPTLVIGELMSATVEAANQLGQASAHTALAVIPRAEVAVLRTARAWVDTVSSTLSRDVVVLRAYAAALSAEDLAYTSAALAEANALTLAIAARDIALIEATAAVEQAYASAVGARSIAYTAAVHAELTAYIQAIDHELITWTTAEIDTVLGYIRVVEGDVLTVVRQDIAVVQREITATRVEVVTQLEPQIIAVQEEIDTLRATCVDDLCKNLGKYGKDKANLGSVWSIAALLAYAAAAVADPKDTARATADIINPVITAVLDAVTAVTGPAAAAGAG